MKIFIAALLACGVATSASAVTINNGSFELGAAIPGGSFISVPALNSTSITGWTVGGGGVDYVGTYWQAADGERSIDLSRLSAGSVAQKIATVIGQTYKVSFFLSGNPDGGLGQKVAVTSVSGSLPNVETYNVGPSNSHSNMLWQPYSYSFRAFDTTSTLTFAGATYTPYGPALDNVSITAVPEPNTWAMLIVGMGLVGGTVRMRRRTAIVAA
jgi:choice-of-anchor C domain-containing protein